MDSPYLLIRPSSQYPSANKKPSSKSSPSPHRSSRRMKRENRYQTHISAFRFPSGSSSFQPGPPLPKPSVGGAAPSPGGNIYESVRETRALLVRGTGVRLGRRSLGHVRSEAEKKPLVIGVAIALTGKVSKSGKLTLRGYEMWQRDVNAKGGLLGRKVTFKVYDDESNPTTGAKLVERLINRDKVDMIFGPFSSPGHLCDEHRDREIPLSHDRGRLEQFEALLPGLQIPLSGHAGEQPRPARQPLPLEGEGCEDHRHHPLGEHLSGLL